MSVLTTLSSTKTHTGDDSTVEFTTEFQLYESSELEVYLDSVEQESGWSVAINSSTLVGTVTFDVAPETDVLISFVRVLPIDQLTNYIDLRDFPSPQHQETLNRLFMILQQLNTDLSRTIQIAINDSGNLNTILPPASERAGKKLGFDASGNLTVLDP
jgi:hypothetical protein